MEGDVFNINQILKNSFFKENPVVVWNFYLKLYDRIRSCSPSRSHMGLQEMTQLCKLQQINMCLATLNYDNFHVDCYVN